MPGLTSDELVAFLDEPRALFRLVLADAEVATWRMPMVDRGENPLAVWAAQYYHR